MPQLPAGIHVYNEGHGRPWAAQVKLHLLMYLFGEGYVSGREKFGHVWQEVDTKRTRLELVEIFQPTVYSPWSEVGGGADWQWSLLTRQSRSPDSGRVAGRHGLLIRVSSSEMCGRTSFTIIAFVQVPVRQFTGYVCKLVGELYDALEAVVKGRLTGSGALRTLVLVQVSPEVSSDGECVTPAVPVTQGVRCGAVGDSEE